MSRAVGARAEETRAIVRLAEIVAEGFLQPQAAERLLGEAERIAAEQRFASSEDFAGLIVFRQADFALMTGAFARAVEIMDAGMAQAARAGRSGERSGSLRGMKISALASLGRWDEAETLADVARRDTSVVMARMAVQAFVEVLIRQGRTAEAAAAVRATDSGYVTPFDGAWILQTRMRVAYGEGRWDDARAAADEAIGLFEDPARSFSVLAILELCVSGEADRAEVARGRRRTTEEAEARRVGLARLDLLQRGAAGGHRTGRSRTSRGGDVGQCRS